MAFNHSRATNPFFVSKKLKIFKNFRKKIFFLWIIYSGGCVQVSSLHLSSSLSNYTAKQILVLIWVMVELCFSLFYRSLIVYQVLTLRAFVLHPSTFHFVSQELVEHGLKPALSVKVNNNKKSQVGWKCDTPTRGLLMKNCIYDQIFKKKFTGVFLRNPKFKAFLILVQSMTQNCHQK